MMIDPVIITPYVASWNGEIRGPENGRVAWPGPPGICGDTKGGCGGKGGGVKDTTSNVLYGRH
jgi:hypothetical protein